MCTLYTYPGTSKSIIEVEILCKVKVCHIPAPSKTLLGFHEWRAWVNRFSFLKKVCFWFLAYYYWFSSKPVIDICLLGNLYQKYLSWFPTKLWRISGWWAFPVLIQLLSDQIPGGVSTGLFGFYFSNES